MNARTRKVVLSFGLALASLFAKAVTVVEVASDRTLTSDEEIAADTVFDVKAGATLNMNSRALTIAGVKGAGDISNAALTLTLEGGPYTYSGAMAGTLTFLKTDAVTLDEFHFIVGASDALTGVTYTSPTVAATPIWFAPGVGRVAFKKITPSAQERFTTEDTNGDPVTVLTALPEGANSSWRVTGSGDFYTTNRFGGGGINYNIFSELTGRMGPNANGHETTSNNGAIENLEGVALGVLGGSGAKISFNLSNYTIPWNLYGAGTFADNHTSGTLTLPAAKLRTGAMTFNYKGDICFKGGLFYSTDSGRTIACAGAGASLIFDHASPGPNSWPYEMRYDSYAGNNNIKAVVLTNGSWYGINSYLPTNYVITTKSRFFCGGGSSTKATAENPGRFYVDGANFDAMATANTARDILPDTFELHVGPNGAGMDGFQYASFVQNSPGLNVNGLVKTSPDCETDGGITLGGAGNWNFKRPIGIKGDFRFKSGFLTIPGNYTGTPLSTPFGTCDFIFGDGYLSDASSLTELPLANGAGAKLRIDGAAELQVTLGDTWKIGSEDAAESSLVRETGLGGVLVLNSAGAGDNAIPVLVNGGVETTAVGLPKVPVLRRVSDDTSVGVGNPAFATYTADVGFGAFSGYAEYLADCTATSVFRPVSSFTVESDTTIAAIDMKGQTLTIGAGAKLTVGDGENPAVILMNNSATTDAKITGAGTLDFGTSEGVFVSPVPRSRSSHATIETTIAGSAGVSYHGVYAGFGNGYWEAINLNSANTYTGGTRLCAICAYVMNPKAFSDGTVTVDGGQFRGARLALAAEGLVLSNDVVVSGYGGPHYNGPAAGVPGAISFAVNSELAGNVYIPDRAWIGTYEVTESPYHEGVLSGVVSGESAVIVSGSGSVVMTASNTVRHVELYGKLILRGNAAQACSEELIFGSAGNGVLRIENTEPVTIASRIVGTGKIELAGSAPVTFTDAYTFSGPVDICGGSREVSGLGDRLAKVTNSVAQTTGTLALGGKTRAGSLTVCEGVDLAPAAGGSLNLEGIALSQAALGGSGRVFGGSLTLSGDIQPGGEGAIGTLTLATPLTLSNGAKLVTEVGADGVDKFVFVGDFSLNDLPLEIRQLGKISSVSGTIVETTGALSGYFPSVTKPVKGSCELSPVLDGTRVTLKCSETGFVLLFR